MRVGVRSRAARAMSSGGLPPSDQSECAWQSPRIAARDDLGGAAERADPVRRRAGPLKLERDLPQRPCRIHVAQLTDPPPRARPGREIIAAAGASRSLQICPYRCLTIVRSRAGVVAATQPLPWHDAKYIADQIRVKHGCAAYGG